MLASKPRPYHVIMSSMVTGDQCMDSIWLSGQVGFWANCAKGLERGGGSGAIHNCNDNNHNGRVTQIGCCAANSGASEMKIPIVKPAKSCRPDGWYTPWESP